MIRRLNLIRSAVLAAGVMATLAVGVPAAHANEFPGAPFGDALRECGAQNGKVIAAEWNIHIGNAAGGNTHIVVTVDGTATPFDFGPGQSKDYTVPLKDGVGSHITIVADGINKLADKQVNMTCNHPITQLYFECDLNDLGMGGDIVYDMENWSDVNVHFELHKSYGAVDKWDLTHDWIFYPESISEDDAYHAYITVNGVKVKEVSGVADCKPNPTTTTTTPPTTTSTTMVPVVPNHPVGDPPPSTVTTVAGAVKVAPKATTTTIAATPNGQLPFTGSTTLPLGIAGGLSLAVGAALLAGLRRTSLTS